MFDKQYVINVWSCDSQLPPIVNTFTVCMNSVLIFWWTDVSSDMNRWKTMKSVEIKILNR